MHEEQKLSNSILSFIVFRTTHRRVGAGCAANSTDVCSGLLVTSRSCASFSAMLCLKGDISGRGPDDRIW